MKKMLDPKDIRTMAHPMTVSTYLQEYQHYVLERTLTVAEKSVLIEHLLVRLYVPHLIVVDDTAVAASAPLVMAMRHFLADNFPLEGMVYAVNAEGQYFSQLPRATQRRLEETPLHVTVVTGRVENVELFVRQLRWMARAAGGVL